MVFLVTAYFHFFEALDNAFEVQYFQGFILNLVLQTMVACRGMQLRFFKVETLLHNAFNIIIVRI